jgi:hypothetical protein
MIDPKQQFLSKLPAESNFRNMVMSDVFQSALTLSYAQLALDTRSPEHLEGAKKFMEILTNIGTPSAPPVSFPEKRLDHSVLHPQQPEGPAKEKGKSKKKA